MTHSWEAARAFELLSIGVRGAAEKPSSGRPSRSSADSASSSTARISPIRITPPPIDASADRSSSAGEPREVQQPSGEPAFGAAERLDREQRLHARLPPAAGLHDPTDELAALEQQRQLAHGEPQLAAVATLPRRRKAPLLESLREDAQPVPSTEPPASRASRACAAVGPVATFGRAGPTADNGRRGGPHCSLRTRTSCS